MLYLFHIQHLSNRYIHQKYTNDENKESCWNKKSFDFFITDLSCLGIQYKNRIQSCL